jgi:hypothetical protein
MLDIKTSGQKELYKQHLESQVCQMALVIGDKLLENFMPW